MLKMHVFVFMIMKDRINFLHLSHVFHVYLVKLFLQMTEPSVNAHQVKRLTQREHIVSVMTPQGKFNLN